MNIKQVFEYSINNHLHFDIHNNPLVNELVGYINLSERLSKAWMYVVPLRLTESQDNDTQLRLKLQVGMKP